VQGFTWSDFTAKLGHDYTYRVVALKGKPTALREDADVSVEVATEVESNGTQAVWFNRGAAASQEYARRFGNRRPEDVGPPAFAWLSRGLWEALRDFIGRAQGPEFGLRVAAYEFNSTLSEHMSLFVKLLFTISGIDSGLTFAMADFHLTEDLLQRRIAPR
jgi:hypothetical protein